MKNALVILAGGKGRRFGQKYPKQFYKINDKTIIDIFLSKLVPELFYLIVISIDQKYHHIIKNSSAYGTLKEKIVFSQPGHNRQKSSFNSLKKIKKYNIKNVLIHDAARPFSSNILIKKILKNLENNNNVIPKIQYQDRQLNIASKIDTKVINIQTPQGFDYSLIYKAHQKLINKNFPDDASLIQELGHKIKYVKGEIKNIKITYFEDLIYFNLIKKTTMRSGIGYDIHSFDKSSKSGLKLCGVKLPFKKLLGHSDADVGIHAICDSIFGALSLRDIGYYFPNTNDKYKNIDSSKFLIFCREKLKEKNFKIDNLDVNIIAEKPKITKYVVEMKKKLSKLLSISSKIISIKATTNEKIGFIGKGEGIAAESIIQISNDKYN